MRAKANSPVEFPRGNSNRRYGVACAALGSFSAPGGDFQSPCSHLPRSRAAGVEGVSERRLRVIRVAVSQERSSIRFRNAPKAEAKQGISRPRMEMPLAVAMTPTEPEPLPPTEALGQASRQGAIANDPICFSLRGRAGGAHSQMKRTNSLLVPGNSWIGLNPPYALP